MTTRQKLLAKDRRPRRWKYARHCFMALPVFLLLSLLCGVNGAMIPACIWAALAILALLGGNYVPTIRITDLCEICSEQFDDQMVHYIIHPFPEDRYSFCPFCGESLDKDPENT